MKKRPILYMLAALLLLLCACGDSAAEPEAALTLDETLLALPAGTNADVGSLRAERCYAELTKQGTARISFFKPYLSVYFAPEAGDAALWRDGMTSGFGDENPFVDELRVSRVELCDEIDTAKSVVLSQDSLRQLFQCDETITYTLLCEALEQTPELKFTSEAYYDPAVLSDDPAVHPADAEEHHALGERIRHGAYWAVFKTGGAKLTVRFLADGDGEDAPLVAFNVDIRTL